MTTMTQSPQPQQSSGYGGLLLLTVLTLSHRIRHWFGLLSLGVLLIGGLLLAISTINPDVAGAGAGLIGAGVLAIVLWVVASVLAWLLGIVIQDARQDYFRPDTEL